MGLTLAARRMSKFIAEHKRFLAAADSIGFDAAALEENPEALEEFLNKKAYAGLEEYKARISDLEQRNAALLNQVEALSDTDHAAGELLEEVQSANERLENDLESAKASLASIQTAHAEFLAGIENAGVKLQGVTNGIELHAAIEARQKIFASELLASHGIEPLADNETADPDNFNADPLSGLSGVARAAAAIKARKANR